MSKIYLPSKEDNKKIIRILNGIFKKHFPSLIPSLYGKGKNSMEYHYCLEEDGKLNGIVCAYPSTINVGPVSIKGLGIGMVSTRKSARGKGVMTTLLNHILGSANESYDIAYLTGRRKRYEHFGFYPAGVNYIYDISGTSIQKYKNGNPYTVKKVKSEEDINAVNELSKTGYQVVERPNTSDAEVLRNWYAKLYLLLKDGAPVGFMNVQLNKIERVYVKGGSADDYGYAISAYMQYKGKKFIKVEAIPSEKECIKALDDISEVKIVHSGFKYKIFSFARLTEKLASLAVAEGDSGSYSAVIEVVGKEKFALTVKDGAVNVCHTEEASNIVLTEQQAVSALLGGERISIPCLAPISLHHYDLI